MTGVGQNILNFKAKTCDNNKRKFNSIEKETSNIESPYKRPNIKDEAVVPGCATGIHSDTSQVDPSSNLFKKYPGSQVTSAVDKVLWLNQHHQSEKGDETCSD